MRHTIYFLIEPKAEASREFPLRAESEKAALLLEPLLTSRAFADKSRWRQEEVELAVKLIYVARLREYEFLEDDSVAMRVLESDQISTQLFDKWWRIRSLTMDEGPSEDMQGFLAAVLRKVAATGNPVVDEWLGTLTNAESA